MDKIKTVCTMALLSELDVNNSNYNIPDFKVFVNIINNTVFQKTSFYVHACKIM